jgi:uncharacterized protein YbaR (Trm112 family)
MEKKGDVKNIFLFGLLLLCCPACQKELVSQPEQLTAYEQWRSHNLHHYTIDQSRSCFCPHAGELVRITVRSDTIARVIRISDSSIVTYPFFLSIDSLFGIIRNNKTDSLVIRYNAQYGYPEYLDVDPQQHPVDDGYLYETSNLQIP